MISQTMQIPRPVITNEHGAWAVLVVPLIVGLAAAGACPWRVMLLVPAVFSVFMSYVPAQVLLRDLSGSSQNAERVRGARLWVTAFSVLGVLCAAPLLMMGYWLLLVLAAIAVAGFAANFGLTHRLSRTLAGDLVSVLALTLSGPAAYYVVVGEIDRTALSLWVLNFLFFGCSVFYVHMKIRAVAMRKERLTPIERLSIGKPNLVYHGGVLALLIVLAGRVIIPSLAVLAFVPMAVHAVYGTLRLSSSVRFKNLGFLLVGQAIVFALILVVVQ